VPFVQANLVAARTVTEPFETAAAPQAHTSLPMLVLYWAQMTLTA
jgi:hypothetical protein